MRALCEGCGKPQPSDWKAGDLCSHCGKSVRHDVRCFWCAKWTPFAKFCRSCGAETVEETLYGAARMLKDAGTDRFSVPKMLREMDPDQRENFTRIYQRHAATVARHVDDLRFLERFLFHNTWSEQLQDEMIPQLPLGETALNGLSVPPLPAGDDLQTLKAIQASTPLARTKSLAALARVRLDDWDALKEASTSLHNKDLCPEAVLVLSGWRLHAAGRAYNDDHIHEWLKASLLRLEAGVRLGLLGKGDPELLREALDSQDPETAFSAALALGETGRLSAALGGDDLQKAAAGMRLAELGHFTSLEQTVGRGSLEVQHRILYSLIRQKRAVPELRAALFHVVTTMRFEDEASVRKHTFFGEDRTRWEIRGYALRLLCRNCPPADALRIAQAAMGEREIFRSLLVDEAGLPADSVGEVLAYMVEIGKFQHDHYGLDDALKRGAVPAGFAIAQFPVAEPKIRLELVRLAEDQLRKGDDETLHRFLMNVVFGHHSHEIRAAAWWALHRGYRSGGEHRGEGPFQLTKAQIERFFGSVSAFLPQLAAVLRSPETLKEVGYYEMIANVLRTADPETIAGMQADGSACEDLLNALLEAAAGDYWPNTLESMIVLASQLGGDPRWQDRVLTRLRALGKKGNYHYDKAVRRLELAKHGIPEESDWSKLPEDFVPARFWKADAEGRQELLKVADQQMIHGDREKRSPVLSRFLLKAALTLDDPDLAGQAMHMLCDRSLPQWYRFPLKRDAVEKAYGSFSEFVADLPNGLRSALQTDRRDVLDFHSHLLSNPEPSVAALLGREGEAGAALIQALLEVAAAPKGDTTQTSLRRDAVRFLGEAGSHSAWKKDVIKALEKLHATPDTDQKVECEMALRKLKPPKPPRAPKPVQVHPREDEQPPHVSYGVPEPDEPEVVDYAALQKIAEKMGAELQAKMMMLMAGPGTPDEKMREGVRLSEEFQAAIKKLYGQ